MSARTPTPYADPYLAGVGLGLVLLASFVIAGRGLGASGAFATAAATTVQRVAPTRVAVERLVRRRTSDARRLLRDWLVVEIIGVTIGGCYLGVRSRAACASRRARTAHRRATRAWRARSQAAR